MRDLVRRAASLGLRLHATYLDEDTLGYYSPEEARIYYDMRLTCCERHSVIAHELGHAFYGHCDNSTANERQADLYAARLLIDPARYAELERINPEPFTLAEELGVTVELLKVYQERCLSRLGSVSYARGQLGAGCWLYSAALMG